MSQKHARLLQDQDQIERFLVEVLNFDLHQIPGIIYKIVAGERGLIDIDVKAQTIDDTRFRDRAYKDETSRWKLRALIIQELATFVKPANDEVISLGIGGAVPSTGIQAGKQAYILIGLPASGKSGVANTISERSNALILDADLAKRKLPEFTNYTYGATIVHEESSQIVFRFKENPQGLDSLWELALKKDYNIVIPKIGQDPKNILSLAATLRNLKYRVHLTLISLLKREATIRAIYRFNATGRYVPLGLIFDGYGNDPCLTYYLLRNRMPQSFDSFGAITTNVPENESPLSIDQTPGNPANFYAFTENILI